MSNFRLPIFFCFLLGLCFLGSIGVPDAVAQDSAFEEEAVVVESSGWELVGDLMLPPTQAPVPGVLLLHKANGERSVYRPLALELAERGIASLRLDLRGHGESTNQGRFEPGGEAPSPLIWDAEADVAAAFSFLQSHPRIDAERIGVIGSSYSGEEMAEAGRLHGYAKAYVAISPGSFSEASITSMDTSGAAWLFVASKNERYVKDITEAVLAQSESSEVIIVPGTKHATDILIDNPEMAERVAVWLTHHL